MAHMKRKWSEGEHKWKSQMEKGSRQDLLQVIAQEKGKEGRIGVCKSVQVVPRMEKTKPKQKDSRTASYNCVHLHAHIKLKGKNKGSW